MHAHCLSNFLLQISSEMKALRCFCAFIVSGINGANRKVLSVRYPTISYFAHL